MLGVAKQRSKPSQPAALNFDLQDLSKRKALPWLILLMGSVIPPGWLVVCDYDFKVPFLYLLVRCGC